MDGEIMNEQGKATLLDDLTKKRKSLVASLKEHDFMDILEELLIGQYSDPAHFIYELLQNADDAGATYARFSLRSKELIFAHDGKKPFDISDPAKETEHKKSKCWGHLNAITLAARSTKTNDQKTIGKFGIGFKAVFKYTKTPKIYHSDVWFEIIDLFIPIELPNDHPDRKPDETLFVFPFNNPKRNEDEAYKDISEKLVTLIYPVLFLSNLKKVNFEILEQNKLSKTGLYDLSDDVKKDQYFSDTKTYVRFLTLRQNNNYDKNELIENKILLFSKCDDKGRSYSVGFFINDKNHLVPPPKISYAFCFFPTKVPTGLNFIIHAPFRLNNSREVIKADEEYNKKMIALLAQLAAQSICHFRDIEREHGIKLINDNILDIIPYDNNFSNIDDNNQISFKPFYTEILKVFESEELLPSSSDDYVSAENAYWASVPQIAELFSDKHLAFILGDNKAKWVFTSFGRQDTLRKNKPLTNYIDSITKTWLDEDDIINKIKPTFIETQQIEWLHLFYKWINETERRIENIKTKPVLLNEKNKAVAAFDEKGQHTLFLQPEGDSAYPTVNKALLQNKDTKAFIIKQLEIAEPSLIDEININILPKYRDDEVLVTKPHFKKYFLYYCKCSSFKVKFFLDDIRKHLFVLCTGFDGKQYHRKPECLYFPDEQLKQWFLHSKPDRLFVSFDEYLDFVGEEKIEELKNFLSDLGVKDAPRIFQRNLNYQQAHKLKNDWKYSTRGHSWIEYYIDGCEELLESVFEKQDFNLSNLVWSHLLKFIKNGCLKYHVLYGKHEYFYHCPLSESFESNEAKRLRTQPWLVNNDGKFVSANEITVQTINPEYDLLCDEAKELFQLLGINENIEDSEEEERDVITYAKSLGLSEEEQRQALSEFASRKKATKVHKINDEDKLGSSTEDESEEYAPVANSPIDNTIKEIRKRIATISNNKIPLTDNEEQLLDNNDEDDYVRPPKDYKKIIEREKQKSVKEINQICILEELEHTAAGSKKHTYKWFKALLELELLSKDESNSQSRKISISFRKVEREGESRTLVLNHPSRYIPQFMEDLVDIPLELVFHDGTSKRVVLECVSVKSYTLRVKLKTIIEIDNKDLTQIVEAKIEAKSPAFLLEELKKSFLKLGYDDDYNMQKELCENIEFVFGPPGTGKTTYLAKNVIIPIMRGLESKKVLVLTPTNKAADVLVIRIMKEMGSDLSYKDWLVRFGTTNDNAIEQSGVFRDKTFDIRSLPKNVTVTTIHRFPYDYFLSNSTARFNLNELEWDYIVVDEASMIPLVYMVYLLYKETPEKFIIAGDPFQIQPIVEVDMWKNENIYTMVELKSFAEPTTIPHPYPVELLTTQYRSIPVIGEVFSNFAYGGVLKPCRSVNSKINLDTDGIDFSPINLIKFPVKKYESIYRPKKLNKSNYQTYSAIFTFEFARYLSKQISGSNIEKIKIGIIAPYRVQSDLIEKLMRSATLPENIDVQVGTIHGFQGDECDIIISVFNPPPSISSSPDMFLNKRNIINVSISRARDYLFVLMPDDDTEKVNELKYIKRVEALCKNGECSEWHTSEIEEIMFDSETYIEDNSFSTSHQTVNVYAKAELRYEIRGGEDAVDIQTHDDIANKNIETE